jgi:hypothetical protein
MDLSSILDAATETVSSLVENPKLEDGDTSQGSPKVKVQRVKAPKVERVINASVAKVIPPAPVGVVMDLTDANDAAEFIKLSTMVGVRQAIDPMTGAPAVNLKRKPITFKNPNEVRHDTILLLQCCGFKVDDLGTALSSAVRRARLTLDPHPGAGKAPRLSPTIAGYVAGMPEPERRLVADMKAKQRVLIDAAGKADKAGNKSLADKLLAQARKLDDTINAHD